MIRLLRQLWRDQRGNSYVEMAFITPILTTALLGAIDVSNGYSARLKLEQAAQRTIEDVQQNSSIMSASYSTIASEASTASGVSTSNITVTNYLECSNDGATWTAESSSTSDWDKDSCTSYGTFNYYSHYLSVQIKGSYSPIFSAVLPNANKDGTYTIYGTAGLRFQ